MKTPSVQALTLDMLRLANRHHMDGRMQVDVDAWFLRATQELSRMPKPMWDAGIGHLEPYAAQIGAEAGLAAAIRRHPHAGAETAVDGGRPARSTFQLDRVMLADPKGLATVADAATVLDHIVGPGFDPEAPMAALRHPVRWAGALMRARGLIRDWRGG